MKTSSRFSWVSRLTRRGQSTLQRLIHHDVGLHRPNLHVLAQEPDQLPLFIRESEVAMRYVRLLGSLDWGRFPERDLERNWGTPVVPYGPFVAACLVKVDQQIGSMARLRRYLVAHPALTWVLGFPLTASSTYSWRFDVTASLPTHRHLTRMLRTLPNASLQVLLDHTITLLHQALPADSHFGQTISLDTKHILAWVKENNPKAFLTGDDRSAKDQQPAGDPDCRLGCKKRRNQRSLSALEPPDTPLENPVPTATLKVGTFYWGYATGIVATKVPGWGEFILAELTQPFDRSDVSYFFPLMAATTKRLGCRPRYGAFDAAFDAWYVYAYFHADDHDGFAAVPRVERGPASASTFTDEGLPLCQAGLPMPLGSTFWAKTSLVPHEKGRYRCPLSPQDAATTCPIAHTHWTTGGCVTTLPTSIGARLRHQLDRDSPAYQQIYKQRTATERINSQAVELGIERPHLRTGHAIANQNTLIYILINLRALQRIRQKHVPLSLT